MKLLISRIFVLCAALAGGAVFAQSLSGSFSPASVVASTASTLTLNYTGFTPASSGAIFRMYYRAASFSAGPTFTSTVSDFQGAGAPTAGTAASCTGADTFVTLNWVNFSNAWPTAASGQLGTVAVTTAPTFAASTNVCITDDAGSPVARPNVVSSYTLNFLVPATSATFTASPTSLTFAEGGAVQNIAVTCAGTIGSPSPVAISVASSNTAAFTVAPATLSFTTCPSSQNVAVTPRAADALSNPTQTGNVTFATTTTGATAPAAVGVTVTDNQAPAVYTVTKASATVTEGSATTDTIVITCTGTLSTTPGSVAYAITGIASGTDYTASPASPVSFPACGGATQTITISPRVNDAVVQGNRTGTLTISSPVGGTLGATSTASVAVNDDDTPQTVTVAVTNSPATEAGGVLTYTFTRAGGNAAAVAAPLTVNVTAPAATARFSTTCAATVTFAASATTATCTATGIDNAAIDGNVNVVVAIAAPAVTGTYVVGTPASATGVIADDDFGVTVTTSAPTVVEGQSAVFTINCNGATGSFTANYTITGRDTGSTVTPSATAAPLNCTTGTSTATVTVTTVDDLILGNSRSVTLTLNSIVAAGPGPVAVIVGTPASATVAVLDNDQPVVIPTMGMLGLGLMSLLLAGLAGLQRRRQLK